MNGHAMRGHQSASSRLKSMEAILPDSPDMVPTASQPLVLAAMLIFQTMLSYTERAPV